MFVLSWAAPPAAASTGDDGGDVAPAADVVTVATKELEPFVFVDSDAPDGSGLRGYSIDVWNEVADRLDLETEWVVEETVTDILDSARDGEVDAAIAGISMTARRETVVDFSHPYFDSGLQVAVRPGAEPSIWRTGLRLITSRTMVGLIAFLVAAIAAVAHAVWWTERRHNPEFPTSYRAGIGEALWWSTVSVVTGGEAVKEIRRPLSRILAVVWMIIGLFLFAFVTAQAASAITVDRLQSDIGGIEDLGGRDVVTVGGTVAETFLADINISARPVDDIDVALEGLAAGTSEAVVYDAPVLAYRVNTDYAGRVELAGTTFAPDPYGIAFEDRSDLREAVNAVLLAMARDGTLQALNQKWLGVDR